LRRLSPRAWRVLPLVIGLVCYGLAALVALSARGQAPRSGMQHLPPPPVSPRLQQK